MSDKGSKLELQMYVGEIVATAACLITDGVLDSRISVDRGDGVILYHHQGFAADLTVDLLNGHVLISRHGLMTYDSRNEAAYDTKRAADASRLLMKEMMSIYEQSVFAGMLGASRSGAAK